LERVASRAMEHAVHVDFRREMPLFPLPHVVLLPHVVQPLHIFESRYRQMVSDLLAEADTNDCVLAMATFAPSAVDVGALRPIVCVGQIAEHQSLRDGRSNIAVRGLCRGRIVEVHDPDGARLYHTVRLSPIEPANPVVELPGERERLRQLLAGPRLSRMTVVPQVLQWIDREDVPTSALLELVGYALLCDSERRYRLLAEPMPGARARLLRQELRTLDSLVAQADTQDWKSWPKGLSWN